MRAVVVISSFLFILHYLEVSTVAEHEATKWSSSSTGDIIRLTETNFASKVFQSGRNGMVKFYQSWCGHSIKMKPVWEQLARVAHPSVFIAHVDCGQENEICRSYHITSYPTIRYYLNGTEYDYSNALSFEALREFTDTMLAVQCNPIIDAISCSERALEYGKKWIKIDQAKVRNELKRLEYMMVKSEASTTAELRRWIRERRDILKIIYEHSVNLHQSSRNESYEL